MHSPLPVSDLGSKEGSLSLPQRLRKQYGDRWDTLVDALYSSEPAHRVALMSPFVRYKVGEDLLSVENIRIEHLVEAESIVTAFYRQKGTRLLNAYWAHAASVVPALMACPGAHARVLLLGSSPHSRVLTLLYLLLRGTYPQASGGSSASPLKGSKQAEQANDGFLRASLGNGLQQAAQQKGSTPQRQEQMIWRETPWYTYGEGPAPSYHHYREDTEVPRTPQRLPFVFELFLQTGIRWGCCQVKTTSGDWDELCAEATAAKAQEDNQAAANLKEVKIDGASGSHDAQGNTGKEPPQQDPPVLTYSLPADQHIHLARVFENHVPQHLRKELRMIEEPFKSSELRADYGSGSQDLVVIEAPCAATREAVREALSTGNSTFWPDAAAQELHDKQLGLLHTGFDEVSPGCCLLYCCNSLANEETDGLISSFMSHAKESARVLNEPCGLSSEAAQKLLVSLKRFGVERTQLGWRMLPDLAFQDPQYWSLIQKLV